MQNDRIYEISGKLTHPKKCRLSSKGFPLKQNFGEQATFR